VVNDPSVKASELHKKEKQNRGQEEMSIATTVLQTPPVEGVRQASTASPQHFHFVSVPSSDLPDRRAVAGAR
jgi:hypothetical protein